MRSIIHPYRNPSPHDRRWTSVPAEELIFYVALCVVGAIPVASPIAQGGAFGVEPTIGLMMVIAGIAGLFSAWRVARDQPCR
jgi:hypothetical protein